ncbi:MAG: four helix bundle protein [Rickettsiales bacterium]|jgi:four helix bundle protein|nr:four helix bundle protein [Rickettsiales bacterium]
MMDNVKNERTLALLGRTKQFALRVMKMSDALPRMNSAKNVGCQITRSATSAAANYRAAQRARSKAEFVSKIRIVLEEIDETKFWLEIIQESNMLSEKQTELLLNESSELTAIFCSISKSSAGSK